MKIDLRFQNINLGENGKIPVINATVNGQSVYQGRVTAFQTITSDFDHGAFDLEIRFINKQDQDTEMQDGVIVSDMNFELDDIVIDQVPLQHLKWQSKYVCDSGQVIDGCLFFGPSGVWRLSAYTPILKWVLETNHTLNGDDPTWEEDYRYYQKACQILNKS